MPDLDSPPNLDRLSATVRSARERLLYSQDSLARAAGVSVSTVARIERGSATSAESLKSVCAVLNLDAVALRAASAPDLDPVAEEPPAGCDLPCEPAAKVRQPILPGYGRMAVYGLAMLMAGLCAAEIGLQTASMAVRPNKGAMQDWMFTVAAHVAASEVNRAGVLYSTILPADHPDRAWEPWKDRRPMSWLSCGSASFVRDVVMPAVFGTDEDTCREHAFPERTTRRDAGRTDMLVGPVPRREAGTFLSQLGGDPSVAVRAWISTMADVPLDDVAWRDPRDPGALDVLPYGAPLFIHLRLERAAT